MVLKSVSTAILCTTLLAWSGASIAGEYRPDEFLGLDLSRAVLSPKRLGPATEFTPVPIEAKAEPKPVHTERITLAKPQVTTQGTTQGAHARVEKSPGTRAKTHATSHIAHAHSEKPRGAARTKLVRRHGNPLDAQAFDTRIQAWPCKSGGICNWKR
jgi:hypothetical protein